MIKFKNRIRKTIILFIVLSLFISPTTYHYIGSDSPIETVEAADPPGSFGPWTGDTQNLINNNDTLYANNEDVSVITERNTAESENRIGIIFELNHFTGVNNERNRIRILNSGSELFFIDFLNDGTVNVRDSGGITTINNFRWRQDLKYRIEARNISYSNNNYELWINNESYGTFGFANSHSGFDQIKIRVRSTDSGENTSLTFTDLRLDGNHYQINKFEGELKNFNDGNENITAPGWGENWYDSNGGKTNDIFISTQNDTSINNDSDYGSLNSNNNNKIREIYSESGVYNPDNVSIKLMVPNKHGTNDFTRFALKKGETLLLFVDLEDNNIKVSDGSTLQTYSGRDWWEKVTYSIEIKNINYSNNTYALHINGELIDRFNFANNMDGFDNIQVRHNTANSGSNITGYFDDLRINGSDYQIAEFPGGVMKGFGDGDPNITANGFYGWYDENKNIVDNVNLDTKDNIVVGNFTSNQEDKYIRAVTTEGLQKPKNISIKLQVQNVSSVTGNDFVRFATYRQGTTAFFADLNIQSGSLENNEDGSLTQTDTGYEWRPNITYTIEFRNINWSNHTYDLYFNGEFITKGGFGNNVNDISEIGVRIQTSNSPQRATVLFNDLRVEGDRIEKPKYTTGLTDLGYEGWYNTFFNEYEQSLTDGSISVDGERNRSEIWSSGGYVNISTFSTDITVSDRTQHPDDTLEFWGYHFSDTQMGIRLHMSTPNDQFDPNSNISGNAITVRDGGSWREINQTWDNDTANSIEFVNVEPQNQEYGVRINGQLVENPATKTNHFSMAGNLRKGMQNFEIELDTVVSDNTAGYNDTTMEIQYSDLSLGQCQNQCGAIEFFNVTTEQAISFEDPTGITPTPTPQDLEDLILKIDKFMEHNTTQTYEIIYVDPNGNRQDVSSSATITSSNTSVVSVLTSTLELEATNDNKINKRVTINASYQGLNDSVNVTVANATLENIEILPNTKWLFTIIGCSDSGVEYCLGSTFQWIFFIIIMMITFSLLLNEMAGIAIGQVLLILFFITNYIPISILLGGLIFGLFAGIIRFNKRSQTTLNVKRNNNI